MSILYIIYTNIWNPAKTMYILYFNLVYPKSLLNHKHICKMINDSFFVLYLISNNIFITRNMIV